MSTKKNNKNKNQKIRKKGVARGQGSRRKYPKDQLPTETEHNSKNNETKTKKNDPPVQGHGNKEKPRKTQ